MPLEIARKLWVVFTVPADGHKWQHIMVMNGIEDAKHLKFHLNLNNPDMKVVEAKFFNSDDEMVERTAKMMKDAGPGHRMLQGNEHRLTEAKVKELTAEFGNMSVLDSAEPLSLQQKMANASVEMAGSLEP